MARTGVRTHVRWGRLVALAAAVSLSVSLASGAARAGTQAGPETRPAAVRTYTVEPGDTVWAIAKRLAGPSEDPRPLVDRILAENGLRAGALRAGQVLTLPAP